MVNRLDDVVRGALEVLDAFGLEFCSMRRVAAHLGVQPSALYHHVPDKQTLLALMADRIVAEVEVPDEGDASAWAPSDRARELCRRLRDAMLAVRDGAEVVATASAFRLGASQVEADLTALLGDAVAARTLLLFVFAHSQATQMQHLAASVGVIQAEADLEDSFAGGVDLVLAGAQRV